MDLVELIGRLLFAAMFVNSGVAHIRKRDEMSAYARSMGGPAPEIRSRRAELVPGVARPHERIGVRLHLTAQHEEGRRRALPLEHVEHDRRRRGRPVVEGERDRVAGARPRGRSRRGSAQ